MIGAAAAGAPAAAVVVPIPVPADLTPGPIGDTADAVLVLRALGLGDALTGLPALRGIRRAFPHCRVVLATTAPIGQWFHRLGIVDDVLVTDGLAPLTWPLPGWVGTGGHIAVNLHGSGPQSHRLLQSTGPSELIAYRCALAEHLDGLEWHHDEHEVDRWCRLIVDVHGRCDATDLRLRVPGQGDHGDTVLLHPGAATGSRRWPADRWAWLAAQLAAQGFPVVISGGPAEIAVCREIAQRGTELVRRARHFDAHTPDIRVEAGTLDLPGLADLVAAAQLLVCGDTGVAHLATALSTPSVLLFGPTPARWWGPRIDHHKHQVLYHGEPGYLGDPHAETIDPALEAISQDEVLDAALQQIRRSGRAADPRTATVAADGQVLKAG